MQDLQILTKKKWLNWLIIIGGSFLITFLCYLFFSHDIGTININLYQPELKGSDYTELVNSARAAINGTSNILAIAISAFLLLMLLALAIVLLLQKKMNFKYGIIIIFAVAIIIRVLYSNVTDNIFTRQHDVWSSSFYGHYGIVMNLFKTGHLPPLRNGSLADSYQIYHPKMAHYLFYFAMKFNSLFLGNENQSIELYESIRIFTCFISILMIFMAYEIFKELFKSKTAILIATTFVIFSPIFIRLSAMSNNDGVLYFFLFAAVLFAIRFYKRGKWYDLLVLAIAIGMAMGAKLSGALIAIPVGIMMVYKLVIDVKNAETGKKLNVFLTYVVQYLAFLIICAPIGLYWPIYNLKNYNQPISYYFNNLNSALKITDDFSYADRYLSFSFKNLFASMYEQLWNTGEILLDGNLWVAAFKTSLFGEYSYTAANTVLFSALFYATGLIMIAAALVFFVYLIIKGFKDKKYETITLLGLFVFGVLAFIFIASPINYHMVIGIFIAVIAFFLIVYMFINFKKFQDKLATIFMLMITGVFILFFIKFNISSPYTCTQDFRYIAIILIPGGYAIGNIIEKKGESKTLVTTIAMLIAIYSTMSLLLYSSL